MNPLQRPIDESTADEDLWRAVRQWAYAVAIFVAGAASLVMCHGCGSVWQSTCSVDRNSGVACTAKHVKFVCAPDPTGKPYPAGVVQVWGDGQQYPFMVAVDDAGACLPEPVTRGVQ